MGIMSLALQSVCLLMSLLLFLSVRITEAQGQDSMLFNVMKYGAVADGKTDNAKAFLAAWQEACQGNGTSKILIPQGTYVVEPLIFNGPCNGSMVFLNQGVLKAPTDTASLDVDQWILFRYLERLTVTGSGSFDGQGPSAWPYNQCSKSVNCKTLPISIKFDSVMNSKIRHILSIDSKGFNIDIFRSKNISIQNITISAPGDSPNTDGIHLSKSSYIQIENSVIGTGDDCISFGQGTQHINISQVSCGPGHGISIGSLGKYPKEEDVVGLTLRNCTFNGTSNGVRIKTWAPSQASTASDFTFQDIVMNKVDNPILIDQNYCPHGSCEGKAASEVQIKDVKFINISGTSSSKVAVKLQCSQTAPCENIELEDINLSYQGSGGPAVSVCSNVHGFSSGKQMPPSCVVSA